MAPIIDLLHLVIVAAGVGIGAWALIALRRSLPRGRFAVFMTASAGALFGCAALSGEVGLMPPPAWFVIVMAVMVLVATFGYRTGRMPSAWR